MALQFAYRHPDRTSALVMLSAISHVDPPMDPVQTVVLNVMFRSNFVYWFAATHFQASLVSMFGVPGDVQAELSPTEKEWISGFLQSMHPMSLRQVGIFNDM